MQRAVKKDEKKEDEEVVNNGGFSISTAVSRKCVVIMEGHPQPGTVKGRMSFQQFNPSINKLAEELENRSNDLGAGTANSQNVSSGTVEVVPNGDGEMSESNNDHKRKLNVMESEETQYPSKSLKNVHGNQQVRASSSKKKSFKNKHNKNKWSVLRPQKVRE